MVVYLFTFVSSVKKLDMFMIIFSQKNSPYESGGAMVMDFILECGHEEFKSSHL